MSSLAPSVTLAQPKLPVLLARANTSKVMLIIDDSGSMSAGMVHPDFNVNDPQNSNSSYRIPQFIFRLESGAAAPATTQKSPPLLRTPARILRQSEYTTGSLWDTATTLANISTHKAIAMLKSASTTGINVARLFALPTNPSTTGSAVFAVANVAKYGGVNVVDSAGNEFFYFDVNCTGTATIPDVMCGSNSLEDFSHTFVRLTLRETVLSKQVATLLQHPVVEISCGRGNGFRSRWVSMRRNTFRWLFYFATQAQLNNLPQESRIAATKRIVTSILLTTIRQFSLVLRASTGRKRLQQSLG